MRRKILIVDDEAPTRDSFAAYFSRCGFDTATADSIVASRRQTAAASFDLILLDVGLADENGLDLLATVKVDQPGVKVLILTGRGYDGDLMSDALQKGADGYITKGLPMEELLAAVQRTLAE